MLLYLPMLFLCCFLNCSSPSPLRRRKRVPRKIMKIHLFLQCFRRVGRFRTERKKQQNPREAFRKNNLNSHQKRNAEKHAKTSKHMNKHQKYLPKSIPEGSGGLLRASWALPGGLREPNRARCSTGGPFFHQKWLKHCKYHAFCLQK